MIAIHSLIGLINTLEDSIQHYTKLKAIYDISNGLAYLHSLNVVAVSERWLFKIAVLSVDNTET